MRRRGLMTLVLGGARAGKSHFAQELAQQRGERVLFVATAEAKDEAMARRIDAHRRFRPRNWRTVEAPLSVAEAVAREADDAQVVLLDCLTLLAANVIEQAGGDPEAHEAFEQARQQLQGELRALVEWFGRSNADLIVVSNEVGLGLVPANPLGRTYRDLLGWANQWLAAHADEVYMVVAGVPVELKSLSKAAQGPRGAGGEAT